MANDFSVLNSFFDHIYVITLERSDERQQKIKSGLEGLNFTFFYGIDKKDFTIDELIEKGIYDEAKAIELHAESKPMNTGQIGCCWSHRMVYEDMIKRNFNKVLILEDDVVLNKEGFALVSEIIDQLPQNWELWYLDYHKNLRRNLGTFFNQLMFHSKRLLRKSKLSSKCITNYYARKFSKNLFVAGHHNLTSAYAITQNAAKKLIALQTPIVYLPDNLLAHACSHKLIDGYVCCPKIFLHESHLQEKKTKESYVVE